MNENNVYLNVPEHYLFCFNDECELSNNCLHRLAAQHGTPTTPIMSVVNPRCCCGQSCKYYRPNAVVKMAYGMLHSYDKVLASDIASIRKKLKGHFSNTSYYLRRNGQKAITPKEQEYINKIFCAYGYTDGVVFDRYIEETEW